VNNCENKKKTGELTIASTSLYCRGPGGSYTGVGPLHREHVSVIKLKKDLP